MQPQYKENRTQQIIQHAKQIMKQSNQYSQEQLSTLLNNQINYYVIKIQELSSTMLLSDKWNKKYVGYQDVFVFIAGKQNLGQGQRKNKWQSPTGNIYCTILTKQPIQKLQNIYQIVSVSICELLQQHFDIKQDVKIKWVNDIILGNKKIAGILIRSDIQGEYAYIQIGIGINVNTLPQSIANSNCVFAYLQQQHPQRKYQPVNSQQLQIISQKISIRIINYLKQSNKTGQQLHMNYSNRLSMKGQQVCIYDATLTNIVKKGIFIDITSNGYAILQDHEGNQSIVNDGRMRRQTEI